MISASLPISELTRRSRSACSLSRLAISEFQFSNTFNNSVSNGSNAMFNRKQSEIQYYSHSTFVNQGKANLLHSKDQQLAYSKAKSDAFNQTLMFKLLASKFTPTGKELLRRITG